MKATVHMLGSLGIRGWVLAILVGGFSAAVVGQQRAPQATTEGHLDAAQEVRALRAEVRQAARDIMAAQVVVGRLQLIDRRMNFLAAQLADVRRERLSQERRREKPLQALKHAENGMAEGLAGFDYVVAQARSELADIEQTEKALQAREAQFLNQMKSEEQQWIALDARLNELEITHR